MRTRKLSYRLQPTYHNSMTTGAKPSGRAPRRWNRPLVVVCAGLSAGASTAANFVDPPTPAQWSAMIICTLLAAVATWKILPGDVDQKKISLAICYLADP